MPSPITAFFDYLKFEKRVSPHTIISYTADIEQLSDYLSYTYKINDITEANHLYIRSWIVSMMQQNISPRTVNRKISCLKTLYKFLLRQKLVTENPMLKIQSPKTSKRLPVFVERDKIEKLFEPEKFSEDFEGQRNRLIMEFFYATGMRLSELINLEDKNINLYELSIKVLGKRNKERAIPVTFSLKTSIEKYLKERNKLTVTYPNFFLSKTGKKMGPKAVYRIVNLALGNITTLSKKSPHVLRHTFATHMLNNGADINAIKELLGHSSLAATQVYTHNTIDKLKNIHKLAHPKA